MKILHTLYKVHRVCFFMYTSDAASGRAGWALAHPEFGSSVNSITARGADYAHHITASPPGIENPAASLLCHVNHHTPTPLTFY